MLESEVELPFVQACKKRGMTARKYKRPGRRSDPDRLVFAGNGYVEFVEVKAPGKVPTDAQLRIHDQLRKQGYLVHVLDHPDDIEELADAIRRRAQAIPAPRV